MIYRCCAMRTAPYQDLQGLCITPFMHNGMYLTGAMTTALQKRHLHQDMIIVYARCSTTNKVVGWAALFQYDKGSSQIGVFVAPSWRRNGIGTKLMQILKTQDATARSVWNPGSTPAEIQA